MSSTTISLVLVLSLSSSASGQACFSQAEAAPDAAIELSFEGALVTLEAHNAELGMILDRLARQTGLVIESDSSLTRRIDVVQSGVPLAQLLEHLLVGHGFVLQLAEDPELGSTGRVWIFGTSSEHVTGDLPPPEPTLAEKLLLQEPTVALAEMARLIEQDQPPGEPLLTELAQRGQSIAVREEAIYALGEIGGALAMQTLETVLQHSNARLRSAAIDALGDLGTEDAAWALAQSLSDERPELREQAVLTLGSLGGDAAIEILEQALFDEDEEVRSVAAEVLADLRD